MYVLSVQAAEGRSATLQSLLAAANDEIILNRDDVATARAQLEAHRQLQVAGKT